MKNDEHWKLITEFPISTYTCGLKAGDKVRLIKDLKVTQGGKVLKVIPKGDEWAVLKGTKDSPRTVWFRRSDGKVHTWDDEIEIFDYFEVVKSA